MGLSLSFLFACKVVSDPSLSVLSVCMCVSVCVSLASDSSETGEAITVRLGTVTASDMII